MEAIKEKEIMKEAGLLSINGKVCVFSGIELFNEAKNIVVEVYKNIGFTNALLKELQNSDVFTMRLLKPDHIAKINAFIEMSDLWCGNAKAFVQSTIGDVRPGNKTLIENSSVENSKVVKFPSLKSPMEQRIKKFLEFSGIEYNNSSTITESDALAIVITANSFISEAYKLLTVARLITNHILNYEDGMQALIGFQLLDDINLMAARNEVWLLKTNRSKFRQNQEWYKPESTKSFSGRNIVDIKVKARKAT